MPIGNDIIDLEEASKHRPQYYDRLKATSFTEDEWLLTDLPDGNIGLWMLWSLKEATFKALVQGDWNGRRFFPKDYRVTSLKQNANDFIAETAFKNRVVRTTTSIHSQFLHTVTQPENEAVIRAGTFRCVDVDYDQQSAEVRLQAIHALSEYRDLDGSEIVIRKNEDQIPQFFVNAVHLDAIDLSLSHHGNYGAYAMAFSNAY